jgi:hypothetical protein
MYYISLGRHCNVAYNIKKFIDNNIPTQFFDWSRTDFKCVLFILNLRVIDTIFNIENIIVDKESYKHENEFAMTLNNFVKDNLCLLYHHDIKYKEYNQLEINKELIIFINKYKRRYSRLIELIKINKQKCFIYNITNDFDYNDATLFNKILTSINEHINYILVLLIEEEDDTYIYCKYKDYFKINLKHFKDINIAYEWTNQNYDWKKIFEIIENFGLQSSNVGLQSSKGLTY